MSEQHPAEPTLPALHEGRWDPRDPLPRRAVPEDGVEEQTSSAMDGRSVAARLASRVQRVCTTQDLSLRWDYLISLPLPPSLG